VIFNNGAFGGAEKRFTNLFLHLCKKYPGNFYYIINKHLSNHIDRIFSDLPLDYIKIVGDEKMSAEVSGDNSSTVPQYYKDIIPDPLEVDSRTWLPRKIYWYYKNKGRQKKLFNEINSLREKLGIEVFMGVFSGILPLVFYFESSPKKVSVIFSDMDSWFTDVYSDPERLWYRKYFSFNYALENADMVDYLSPYISEGVKKLGVKINPENISIVPCSFIDYSLCRVGEKKNFEIAFSSRLEPDKNPMMYLDAAKEIINELPAVKFHILGEGSLVNEIKNFISLNDLDQNINFRFHKNPPEILAETSVFVSLQSGTNYPSQSVLEAMACGNAVVASNTGDTGLFINDSNGILIDLNCESLVKALRKLINEPAIAKNIGMAGKQFAEQNHTIDKASAYYLELFEKAHKKLSGS